MKKSKKIPKTHLPKFTGGGGTTRTLANGNQVSDATNNIYSSGSGNGTQDTYNSKRMSGVNMNTGSYIAAGTALAQGGVGLANTYSNNGTPDDAYKTARTAENGVVSAVAPAYGMLHSGVSTTVDMASGATDAGKVDSEGNLTNRSMTKQDMVGKSFADPLAAIAARGSYKGGWTDFSGNAYADDVERRAKEGIAAEKLAQEAQTAQNNAYQQQQNDYINNAIQSGLANQQPQNSYVQYAMGGMKFGMGGANAEIESEENVVAPNGGFLQANGPTHEKGGVPVSLPGNSMIFSDRLKLGKKTFADLNKVNNTNKEDKVLESNKYGNTSKSTAELMKMAKNKNSEMLFKAQEALKQAKVEAYAKRMGVKLPSIDIRKEARDSGNSFKYGGTQLPKFLTGGRYVDGVWVEDNQPMQGFQADTWQQSSGPVNNVGNTTSNGTMITNEDFNKFKDSSHAASNNQIINQGNKREVQLGIDIQRLAAQEMSGDANTISNKQYNPRVTDPNFNKFDWQGLGTNVAMGLANNAGNIFNLSRYNKPEVERYSKMKATYLDPTAALRDATEQTRRAEYNVRNASSGNAGTYLSNRVALNAQNIENKDRIRQQYANANAGISNSTAQYNNQLAQQEVIANAQNRARTRSGKGEAISQIGKNYNQQVLDTKKGKMDDSMMEILPKLVNDPSFMKFYEEYKKNNPNG